MTWQPIETAPKGVSRHGKSSVCWMLLAWPHEEGGFNTGHGLRVNDTFYSCGTFYTGGPFDGKQFSFREMEVNPTHWMPSLDEPEVK